MTVADFEGRKGGTEAEIAELLGPGAFKPLARVQEIAAPDTARVIVGVDPVSAAGFDFGGSVAFAFTLVGTVNGGIGPASKHRNSHGWVDAIGSALWRRAALGP